MFDTLIQYKSRMSPVNKNRIFTALFVLTMALFVSAHSTLAQTTTFTYQGRLTDAGAPANGAHDFEFKLYDAAGAQVGATLTREDVVVTDGVFVVELDFGVSPFASTTASTLEIGVRPGAATGAFTALAPRQPLTSTPYAIKTLSAEQLGGVAADQYVKTDDPRLTDGGPPGPGSSNYIQNQTAAAQPAGFSISGDGTAGGTLTGKVVSAATQFNIGGNRVLTAMGTNNVFAGVGAGQANVQGKDNAFFGFNAGLNNAGNALGIAGNSNSFFGSGAGRDNTVGSNNSFYGAAAGSLNKSNSNSFFGSFAGGSATTGTDNSFFGVSAGSGFTAFGDPPTPNTGSSNSYFGVRAGIRNRSGSSNSFFGIDAGRSNRDGSFNTFIGSYADGLQNLTLTNATAIGVNAFVTRSNSLVLGSIAGVNGATESTNVGIGTSGPTGARLHVVSDTSAVSGVLAVNRGTGTGVLGNSTRGVGVFGSSSSSGIGVFGSSGNGVGVYGSSSSSVGVIGQSISEAGVAGDSRHGVGVSGTSNSSVGVVGSSSSGVGVYGSSTSGLAGDFQGNVRIVGFLSVSQFAAGGPRVVCFLPSGRLAVCSSSLRYKTAVQPFSGGLELINRLRPVEFDWRASSERDLGLIAEEVDAIEPLLVTRNDKGEVEGVKYDRIAVTLINGIKEQQAQIEQQQNLIKQQETRLAGQQKLLQQQQSQVEGLKKLICLKHAKADVCK